MGIYVIIYHRQYYNGMHILKERQLNIVQNKISGARLSVNPVSTIYKLCFGADCSTTLDLQTINCEKGIIMCLLSNLWRLGRLVLRVDLPHSDKIKRYFWRWTVGRGVSLRRPISFPTMCEKSLGLPSC